MRSEKPIEHIFSELYTISDEVKISYCKVKVLECLLSLGTEKKIKKKDSRTYFSKAHVEAVKQIRTYLTTSLDRHFTLEELSMLFNIPLTSMKVCFKGVYGTSIYAYMRRYRMEVVALMLRYTNKRIVVYM